MIDIDLFEVRSEKEKTEYEFKKCQYCLLYPCELVNEYNVYKTNNPEQNLNVSYNPNESEYCEIRRLHTVKCVEKYVSDGIKDQFKIGLRHKFKIEKNVDDKWEARQPIFLSAPTGSGKNTFIENTFLQYIKNLNYERGIEQRVLILSNRIALRMQILKRIRTGDDSVLEEDNIYNPYDNFPFVDVISYQGLLHRADDLKQKQDNEMSRNRRYLAVVCDEAHFFTSDAMFNHDTAKILYQITNIFKDSLRIYMTATPYECLAYITEYERINENHRIGVFYHFQRNYDYLDIKYYSHEDELLDLVANSKEKWLIFIDNIEKCRTLKKKIDEYMETNINQKEVENDATKKKSDNKKEVVFAVDADSKRNEKYRKMIYEEKFPDETQVLITTSVIDNGINFKDPKLKHVVISDISKVKCIQEVGRVRVGNPEDRIMLYIKRHDEKTIECRIRDLEQQQDAYHDYDLAYNRPRGSVDCSSIGNAVYKFKEKYFFDSEFKIHENAKHWFGQEKKFNFQFHPSEIYYNGIARSLVDTLIPTYKAILAEMRRTDNGQEVTGQKYLEYQLSWFGKTYDISNDLTLADKDKGQNNVIEYLESYLDKKLFANEQDEFSANFTALYDSAFQREDKNKGRLYGISKINKLMEKQDMTYMVESQEDSTTKKMYWSVIQNNEAVKRG